MGQLQVATWEGKAALPALNRFQKRFFLHPTTLELYGFVDVGSGWLGRRLFPLYFKCNVDQLLYPGEPLYVRSLMCLL